MSQGYQAAPPGAQYTFPPEIFQLAASYGLGQPQAQYDHTGAGCLRIAIATFLGVLTLSAALLFVLSAQLLVSPFSSFPFPVIFIMPALAILAFLLYGFSLLRSRAYVCTGGLIVLRGKRVAWAMRWDQIQQVWKKSVQTSSNNGQPVGSSKVIEVTDPAADIARIEEAIQAHKFS